MSNKNDFDQLKTIVGANAALDIHKIRSHLDAQKQKEDDARYEGYLKQVEMVDYVEFCERAHKNFKKQSSSIKTYFFFAFIAAFIVGAWKWEDSWFVGIILGGAAFLSVIGLGAKLCPSWYLFSNIWDGGEKDLENEGLTKAVTHLMKKAFSDKDIGWHLIKLHMERTEKSRQRVESAHTAIISAQIESIQSSKKKAV